MSQLGSISTDLLAAATATGDGPIVNNIVPFLSMALQLKITGSPTQVVVSLKGCIDAVDTTFGTIAVLDTASGYISGEIVVIQLPIPARQVKCSLDTLTGGTNPTVTAHFSGSF
jgi:hypothetical protein